MREVQIVRFLMAVILTVVAVATFSEAANSDMPWIIFLSVIGTIAAASAVTATVMFIREFFKGFSIRRLKFRK